MTLKSVIDVDVADDKFQRFQDQFNRYSESLAAMPARWKEINKFASEYADHMERARAAAHDTNLEGAAARGVHAERERHLRVSNSLWENMARSTATIASNVASATVGIIKWMSLAATGGLFGMDLLAGAVGSERRSAAGLGLSIGQEKAFGLNFGRLIDTQGFLGWMNSMETDVTKQGAAYALLGHGLSGNSAQDSIALLTAVRGLAQRTPLSQLGPILSAYGLHLGADEQRRLHSGSDAEFNQLMARYRRDALALNINDPTASKWQDFSNQLSRAGDKIFKVFVEGLTPLVGPLERLSDDFASGLGKFMASPAVKNGIVELEHLLGDFATSIESGRFQKSVDSFLADTGVFADAMHGLAQALRALGYGIGYGVETAGDIAGAYANEKWRAGFLKNPTASAYAGFLAETDRQFKLPAGFLEIQKRLESGGMLTNIPNSSAGAIGAFQLMPRTAKSLGVDPNDLLQAAYGAGMLDAQLLARYHGDVRKALAAFNWNPADVDFAIAKYGRNWDKHLPAETSKYLAKADALGLRVLVQNETGGNANVTLSAMAGTP